MNAIIKTWLLCYCFYSTSVFAIDSITLKLGSTIGTDWQAEEIIAQVQWLNSNQIALALDIASVTLPLLKKPLEKLHVICQRAEYNIEKITCSDALMRIGGNLLDKPTFNLSFTYFFNSQKIELSLSEFAFADGKFTLRANFVPASWQAQININEIKIEKLLTQISTLIDLPFDFSFGGNTTLKISLSGNDEVQLISIEGQANDFSFSDVEGEYAGEKLAMKIALEAKKGQINPQTCPPLKGGEMLRRVPPPCGRGLGGGPEDGFQVQGTLTVKQGEVYIDPIYVEVTEEKPITMAVDLIWQPQHLNIQQFTYTHTDVVTLQGSSELALKDEKWGLDTLSIQSQKTLLEPFYTHYLQTWLQDSDNALGNVKISGAIKIAFNWNEEDRHWFAHLYEANLEDQQNRFGIKGLHGKMQWHNHATDLPSHLHWTSAYFASSIPLGASQLRVNWHGNQIKFLAPWYQPIFDGALRIEQFRLTNLGEDNMAWQLNGRLYPISLRTVSTSLEWPPLSGKLSGEIPSVLYRNNQLKMDGELKMRVFDGDIVIHQLHLNDPFGDIPTLKTDIDVTKINLKTLTNFIEFGEIQGQLSGYIHQLHLVNWQPVSFDAYFGTPENDPFPHKMSQKAIENLSFLSGGGTVNTISRGLLRFFKHFYYRRIGWGCRLQNGICQMKGAGPAGKGPGGEGYYIIKGGRLPQINIIGYNKNVDWHQLITRLKRVANISTDFDELVIE
jgi:hypothetical protein